MPAIADQVTTLENDHAAALASIDALTAKNSALTDALAAMTAAKTTLETQLAELNKHVDDVKTMVENVATSALTMLKTVTAQAEAGTKAVVSEGAKVTTEVETAVTKGVADAIGLLPDTAPAATLAAPAAPSATLIPALTLEPAVAPPKPTLVAQVESAVDRILHHSSGGGLTINRAEDHTMLVEHSDGLPIFLRRDTVFQRGNRPTI